MRATGLAGACGLARGVRDPFQGMLATSDGGRLWAFRYSGEGRSGSQFLTRDVRLPGQVHPGRQILRRVSGDTRLVVCELIGDLPGAWTEVPGASHGVTGKAHGQLLSLTPGSRRRPGDRVPAGRPRAAADRPVDVGPVRAENLVHGSDQQSCSPSHPAVMITGHVPAVHVPPDHAASRVAAARPA